MSTTASKPSINSASPFAAWKVDHAGIRVPDFDLAIAWYADKLDLRLKKQVSFAGLTFAFLSPAGNEDFVFELLAGPGAERRPTYKDLRGSYKTAGWHHICFRVENVDEGIQQLKIRGVTVVSEPHDVIPMRIRVAFFADPWGNLFELTHPLELERAQSTSEAS